MAPQCHTVSRADPEFLERGFNMYKCVCVCGGGGLTLLILSHFFLNIP